MNAAAKNGISVTAAAEIGIAGFFRVGIRNLFTAL